MEFWYFRVLTTDVFNTLSYLENIAGGQKSKEFLGVAGAIKIRDDIVIDHVTSVSQAMFHFRIFSERKQCSNVFCVKYFVVVAMFVRLFFPYYCHFGSTKSNCIFSTLPTLSNERVTPFCWDRLLITIRIIMEI